MLDLDDDEFDALLEEENSDGKRFQDIRLAVATLKGIDPIEAVVLTFLSEGRFDMDKKGWEFDLTSTLIWDEVEHVVHNSREIEELSYIDDDGDKISGESILEEVIKDGTSVMIDLRKREAEIDDKIAEEEAQGEEEEAQGEEEEYEEEDEYEVVTYVEVIEEEYYEDDYYDNYYDPYYVDPIFVAALILF